MAKMEAINPQLLQENTEEPIGNAYIYLDLVGTPEDNPTLDLEEFKTDENGKIGFENNPNAKTYLIQDKEYYIFYSNEKVDDISSITEDMCQKVKAASEMHLIRYEERTIIVAQGIECHETQIPAEWRISEYLPSKLGSDVKVSSDNKTVKYTSHEQRIHFTISIITEKDDYKERLGADGLHVIYDGHARYGRGPCFGDDPSPGEDWGNGSDPNVTGLYRMGFTYLAVPVSEILKHQYTCNPVRAKGEEPPPREECHPDIRAVYSKLKGFKLSELDPNLHTFVSGTVDSDDKFWGFKKYYHGKLTPHIVLHAGWENTATDPMDLGATTLNCRSFCHFGCSTFKHNYPILRDPSNKNWQRTDTDRFAYWTTASSDAAVTPIWLHHLLTYNKPNAFQPENLSDVFKYAVKKTNKDLRGRGYQVI
jgi:hypothetical protein